MLSKSVHHECYANFGHTHLKGKINCNNYHHDGRLAIKLHLHMGLYKHVNFQQLLQHIMQCLQAPQLGMFATCLCTQAYTFVEPIVF